MKKIILLLSTLLLFITSCTSDADPLPVYTPPVADVNTTLPKKIITTESTGDVYTETYVYSGTKLVKVINEDMSYEVVTYTGNLITKTELFLSDNTLEETATFEYNSSGQLIKAINLQHSVDIGTKETYTYDVDNNETISYFSGDLASQTNLYKTAIVTIVNDEVATATVSESGLVTNYTYTYDTKNNPYKNITGFKNISRVDRPFTLLEGIKKNTLTINDGTSTQTYSYLYNANNFPTRQSNSDNGEVLDYIY